MEQLKLVRDTLVDLYPEGEEIFSDNANDYIRSLTLLHLDFNTAFGSSSDCSTRTVAANHNAYSYLSERYNIEFITVHGLDPEGEPTLEDIAKVIGKIDEKDITVIFIEEYTDPSSVQNIVDETGVQVLYLYTMEMAPTDGTDGQSDSSDNYLTLMQKNLENLKLGLGCTA